MYAYAHLISSFFARVTTSVDKEAALLKIEIEDELTELAEMHSFECDQSVRRTKQENVRLVN